MAPNDSNSPRNVDSIAARLDAVERAVTTGDSRPSATEVSASQPTDDEGRPEFGGGGDARDADVEALRERVATLEAELDAVRGLVGGVRAVGESVERRADAALAKADRLESSLGTDSDLVVERVPVADLPGNSTDCDAGDDAANPETDDDEDSLAARLREVL